MLRRIAALMVLAVIAGPAMTFECFVSCAMASPATTAETCHGAADRTAIAADERTCTDGQAQVSPFVKAPELRLAASIEPAGDIVGSPPLPDQRIRGVRTPDPGPPDRQTVIPLRI